MNDNFQFCLNLLSHKFQLSLDLGKTVIFALIFASCLNCPHQAVLAEWKRDRQVATLTGIAEQEWQGGGRGSLGGREPTS